MILIKITADSTCDLPAELMHALNISRLAIKKTLNVQFVQSCELLFYIRE